MASSLEKVGGLTLSTLKTVCGVFEFKALQVTKGFVKDGYLEFLKSNVLLLISVLGIEHFPCSVSVARVLVFLPFKG